MESAYVPAGKVTVQVWYATDYGMSYGEVEFEAPEGASLTLNLNVASPHYCGLTPRSLPESYQ